MIPPQAMTLVTYLCGYVRQHAPEADLANDRDYQTALKQFDAAVLTGDQLCIKEIGNAIARRIQTLCKEAMHA